MDINEILADHMLTGAHSERLKRRMLVEALRDPYTRAQVRTVGSGDTLHITKTVKVEVTIDEAKRALRAIESVGEAAVLDELEG